MKILQLGKCEHLAGQVVTQTDLDNGPRVWQGLGPLLGGARLAGHGTVGARLGLEWCHALRNALR